MSNAIEEGVLLDIDNPGHTDTGKMAVSGGGALGVATYIALSSFLPGINPVFAFVVGVVVMSVVALWIHKRLKARHIAKEAARMASERAAHEAETEAAIAKMKEERTS